MNHLSQPWPLRAGRKGWLLAALACLALIAGIAVFDAQISQFGQSLPAPVVAVAAFVTQFGESGYLLIPALGLWLLCALLAVVISRPLLKLAFWQAAGVFAFVFIGVGLPSLFTTIVKRIIGRGRPALADSVGPFGFEPGSWLNWLHQSFPSGHTTTAFAICFVVSFLVPRAYGLMLVFAGSIAVSRVVLGAHYATDLIGGAVVGTLGAYLVRNAFATRRWVFEARPDGTVTRRPLAALRRLLRRRS